MVKTRSQTTGDATTDVRKLAAKQVAEKKKRERGHAECRTLEDYTAQMKAIDDDNITEREKMTRRRVVEKTFTDYLIKKQSNEEVGLGSGDEAEVDHLASTLLSVKDYVDRCLADKGVIEDASTASQCLAASGLSALPVPLDFSNPAVSLNSHLWPIVLERATPEDLRDDFSERACGGRLRRSFERQVLESITQRAHGVVKSEPGDDEREAVHALGAILAQVGAHWMAGLEPTATSFLSRWSPLLDEAKRIVVDTITPAMLERLVGHAEARDFGARSMLDSTRLPVFIVPAVEQVLRRPRWTTDKFSEKNMDKSAAAPALSKRLQRTMQRTVQYEPTKHLLDTIEGVSVVRDKETRRILGKKKE
jgi:hypothetical protein